jgi:predicted dehydrogenase
MLPLFTLDYAPKLPSKADYGIGIIGAGQIVNQAHLPAYRKAGFRVLAITDIDRSVAEQTAARFEIPRVCGSVEELLSLHDVDIVDLAVPARHNPSLTTQALRAGKHVLAQKPIAETLSEAETMVSEAQRNKRKLAINHQMRWSPSVRAASDLLRKKLLGEVLECTVQVQIRTAWDSWPWLRIHPYPEIYYHSIHYVDAMRGWLGDPLSVYATLAHFPGSGCAGPTRSYLMLEYGGNLRASISVNHHSVAPEDDLQAQFAMEGTDGRCEGLIGLLLNYPTGRSDALKFSHRELTPGGSIRMELQGRWFPGAFIGPMSSLMEAITNGTEPETSGAAILGTLRLIEAIRQSHETKQVVAFQKTDH